MAYLSIFLWGGVGCCLRYFFQTTLNQEHSLLPWGTVLSNMLGCLLIGALSELLKDQSALLKLAVLTGLLGGLTTLSSFAFELLSLIKGGSMIRAFLYWTSGSLFSLAFVWIGTQVAGRD